MHKARASVVAIVLCCLCAGEVSAQQIDMAAIQRWSNVKKVRYVVSAVFDEWTSISSTVAAAQGKVTDSYSIEFDWDVRKGQIIGDATYKNGKSSVGSLRDTAQCTTPVLKGDYEHFEITAVKSGPGKSQVELSGMRTFPIVDAPAQCPASKALSATPAKRADVKEILGIPDPQMMGLVGMPTGNKNMTFSADKKSFILKLQGGWTLTFTPTPL